MGDTRALGLSDRLRLAPCATRRVGSDLLVSSGGASAPVERLTGNGPELWAYFSSGLTLADAAARLARRLQAEPSTVEPFVVEYAEALVRARLAEPVP